MDKVETGAFKFLVTHVFSVLNSIDLKQVA
jgi:hypothetical protein